IVGFGAHNATEGFGIAGPLTGIAKKPEVSFLVKMGIIGGSPTFFGTIVGSVWVSQLTYILFLSLAGGALIYVTLLMYNTARRELIDMKKFIPLAILALLIVPAYVVAARSDTGSGPKPSIVLIHGAWADGSSWSGVIQRLQEQGYTVYAPPNPLRGLTSDSAYIASFLQTISGPIILVGHSYGGAVITNAATGNPNVKALVYIDAFAPDQGESL